MGTHRANVLHALLPPLLVPPPPLLEAAPGTGPRGKGGVHQSVRSPPDDLHVARTCIYPCGRLEPGSVGLRATSRAEVLGNTAQGGPTTPPKKWEGQPKVNTRGGGIIDIQRFKANKKRGNNSGRGGRHGGRCITLPKKRIEDWNASPEMVCMCRCPVFIFSGSKTEVNVEGKIMIWLK